GFEQLLAAIMELRADRLLYARIGEIALAGWFLGHELHNAELRRPFRRGINHADDRAVLAGLKSGNSFASCGIGYSLETRLRKSAKIAATAGRFRIFGILHRERCEVVSAVKAVGNHLNLLAGVGFVLGLVVLVLDLAVRCRGHTDQCQMV